MVWINSQEYCIKGGVWLKTEFLGTCQQRGAFKYLFCLVVAVIVAVREVERRELLSQFLLRAGDRV